MIRLIILSLFIVITVQADTALGKRFSSFLECRNIVNPFSGDVQKLLKQFEVCTYDFLNLSDMGPENAKEYASWLLGIPKGTIKKITDCPQEKIETLSLLDDFSKELICFEIQGREGFVFFKEGKITRISF